MSIIITTLDGGDTIDSCLSSIAAQEFDAYELVIVDAGSTDNTLTVIDEYSDFVAKLVVISKIGLYAGLNEGVRMATGEWLYFMGCDDRLYAPSTLQKVADAIKAAKRPVTIAAGNVAYSHSGYVMKPSFGSPYLMQYRLHHQGTFYHHTLFEQECYNETLRISADYEFNLRQALKHEPYLTLDFVIALYGEEGVSSKQYARNFAEIQNVNSRLFSGYKRWWVTNYNLVTKTIWLLRKRMGLLNLKVKLNKRTFFKDIFM